jgi:hypothetical protein
MNNIGSIFCNAKNLHKGDYIALPVVVWDVVVETARIPSNYFSELIKKILSVEDKSIEELHDLTNLDEKLILYILDYDLDGVVLKGINKWHLKESVHSKVTVETTQVTILQSMISGKLIPHPVFRNNLEVLAPDFNEKDWPEIKGGTPGKPSIIRPYIIFPSNVRVADITEKDIDAMWDEYEYNDSELSMSDFCVAKSEFIKRPERIVSFTKRFTNENVVDFLLVKVNTDGNCEQYVCQDLLQPTDDISMDFLTRDLKICVDDSEKIGVFLGLRKIEVPLELKDVVENTYPNFPDDVVNEICRFLALKNIVNENAKVEMDDNLLSRLQTMYECLLRVKDICEKGVRFSDNIYFLLDDIKNERLRRRSELKNGLHRRNLILDEDSLKLLCSKSIWDDVEKSNASLKSLILRHLLAYFDAKHNNAWFITQLVNKGIFSETLRFLLDMAQRRNFYQHYNAERQRIPYHYDEFFAIVENQLKIFNEVY